MASRLQVCLTIAVVLLLLFLTPRLYSAATPLLPDQILDPKRQIVPSTTVANKVIGMASFSRFLLAALRSIGVSIQGFTSVHTGVHPAANSRLSLSPGSITSRRRMSNLIYFVLSISRAVCAGTRRKTNLRLFLSAPIDLSAISLATTTR